MKRLRGLFLAGAATAALFAAAPALAQAHGSATWGTTPGSGNWNTGTNWVGNVVPNGSGDTATFDKSTTANVALSQNTEVNTITFNPGAAANPYTITAMPGTMLTISGAGVVNNSGVAQTVVTGGVVSGGVAAGGTRGVIQFLNNASAGNSPLTTYNVLPGSSAGVDLTSLRFLGSSTAGSASISVYNGSAVITSGEIQGNTTAGGQISFGDNSSAGNASIRTIAGGQNIGGNGSGITFYGSSTASRANIVVDGSTIGNAGTSLTFGENATAANATITVRGDGLNNINTDGNEGFVDFTDISTAGNATLIGAGGRFQFFDTSSAGSATITLNGGGVDFGDNASGGTARIVMNGAAALDISATQNFSADGSKVLPGTVSIGSVEGSGNIRLGESVLTIGTNNLSTVFSGGITEGGREFDEGPFTCAPGVVDLRCGPPPTTGNALTKTGTGTLTLSGASTYTGPTTVAGGTLSVTGSLASAVAVNSGGTLTDSGRIGGLTLAAGGRLASTGTPSTLTVAGAAGFANGSTLALDITAGGMSDFLSIGGAASLGGATLNIAALPGTYTNQSYTLLTAAGGLTGTFTFGGVTGGTLLNRASLSYTANSVLLSFGGAVWKSAPTSGDWNTAANWVGNFVPNGSTDTATFDQTSIPGVSLSQNVEVNSITFNPAAANPYTITAAAGTTLTISGAGVVNNSGTQQSFIAAARPASSRGGDGGVIVFRNQATAADTMIATAYGTSSHVMIADASTPVSFTASAGLVFLNSSTAGHATIVNQANPAVGSGPSTFYSGETQFLGSSSAGNSTIYNQASAGGSFTGASTVFAENASAGSAKITASGAPNPDAATSYEFFYHPGGFIEFYDNSTAANSTITVTGNGATAGRTQNSDGSVTSAGLAIADQAYVVFYDHSTAGSATLNVNGGNIGFANSSTSANALINATSGAVLFQDLSSGGSSRLILGKAAVLDVSTLGTYAPSASTLTPGAMTLGSVEGGGFVRLGVNALTVGGNNLSTTYSGSLTAAGGLSDNTDYFSYSGASPFSLVKAGTGTLTLSGASTYAGATAVNGGTLSVTGSLVSAVTANTGAAITVSGTTGGLSVASGGTALGSGTGRMTVNGAVGFASGSTYAVTVTGAGGADLITASGKATLTGGTVQATGAPTGFTVASVRRIVPAASGRGGALTITASTMPVRIPILTAAGGVTGTFAGVTEMVATITPTLSYDATNVYLTLAAPAVAAQSVALTPNEFAAGTAAYGLPAGSTVLTAVNALALAASPAAFDALSGEIHASAITSEFEAAANVRDLLLERARSAPGPLPEAHVGFWGAGFGNFAHSRTDGNAARLSRRTGGFMIGVDTVLGGTVQFGAAGGYTNLSLSAPARASSGSADGWFGALYAGLAAGPVHVRIGGAYGDLKSDIRRGVAFAGFSDSESAHYGGSVLQGFGEASLPLALGRVAFEPFAGAAALRIGRDGFREAGGAAALAGAPRSYSLPTATVGARMSAALGTVALHASAAWRHLFDRSVPDAALTFASGGSTFVVEGVPIDRDAASVTTGLSVQAARSLTLSADYRGQFGRYGRDNAISGSLRWQF